MAEEKPSVMSGLFTNVEFWKVVSSMLWPIIAIIVFFVVKDRVSTLLTRENLTIKVAGMELTVAEATKNIGASVADLQKRLAELETKLQSTAQISVDTALKQTEGAAGSKSTALPFGILWVDDYPSNNAFLIEQFHKDNLEVRLALSTDDAMKLFGTQNFNAVITDLGRHEGGIENRFAGLDLIRRIRAKNQTIPILVYSGSRGMENKSALIEAGATAVFNSAVELQRTVQELTKRQS